MTRVFPLSSSCRRQAVLRALLSAVAAALITCLNVADLRAQSVGLPAPRLLTTMPMGGAQGSQVDITITGDNLDDSNELLFNTPHLTATRKLDADQKPLPNQYTVSIAADCPEGLYEAMVMTRFGLSSTRVFSVGTLPEVLQKQPVTSPATPQELKLNSVCNAVLTPRAADHYLFDARKGQRVGVDCAARGIDSKLDPVLVIADANGRDLLVERRSGALDFTVPADGRYLIKVHELTYQGGPAYYYRLTLRELAPDAPLTRHPATSGVSSFSWPPSGLAPRPATLEAEPNDDRPQAQKVQLPCDVSGSFFPADDVDVFEFEARKGDEWWVEIASERLGLPTDPSAIVEFVTGSGADEKVTDLVEFTDIASPVKVSSNGYAYDGPPYNAGSSDFLGKMVIQQDGVHRLHLTDLFGGTRNDPRNIYRLIIRKAQPDFALVAWPLHMEMRNGDRAALSKPLSLRRGATMVLEVVAIRRDGFEGDIDLTMQGLPEGVTAQGLKIPAGKSRGLLLVTAGAAAPRSMAFASITGRAQVNGVEVAHPCRLATVAWPIPDSWGEIPAPRLMADVPVSVGGMDLAPITIAPSPGPTIEAKAGEKLTIPFTQTRRSDFSGAKVLLRAYGAGFEAAPALEVPLTADSSQVTLDLAALKLPPGDHTLAFVGFAVAKYKHLSETAQPQDIVDIVATEPVSIRIQPAESK